VDFIVFFKWAFLKNPGVFLGRFFSTTLIGEDRNKDPSELTAFRCLKAPVT